MINKVFLFIFISPAICYLIYNIICYKRKSIVYILSNRKKIFMVLNDDFYNIQLLFGAVLSFLLILSSIALIYSTSYENYLYYFIIVYALTFSFFNIIFEWISIKKSYIKKITPL